MEKWQDPKIIALWIAIIIALVITIMGFVIKIMHAGYKRMTEANQREAQTRLDHQKMLLETNLQAQEKERERIAADLHDSLIGKLTLIRMKSQVGSPLPEIEGLLGESIAEARRISHDLTPPLLEHISLDELLEGIIVPWQEKMDVQFYADVRTDAALSPVIKIQVVRIMQELLTNIIKHAAAEIVTVHLRHTHTLALLVKDNGRGFDVKLVKQGLGLNSLEMRTQFLAARYRVASSPGRGTRTLVVMPTVI